MSVDTWLARVRELLAHPPERRRLVVLEDRLVLVPEDLLRRSPTSLTRAESRRVLDVGPVGLSETP